MNRRSVLATLTGQNHRKNPQVSRRFFKLNNGLEPYSGPWTFEQAAHLLRRTTFGPGLTQIRQAVVSGLEGTLRQLFLEEPLPAPPINYYYRNDPFTPIGETWVNQPYSREINLQGYRRITLRAWTLGLLLNERTSIREKLTLFWHNHFAISDINDPTFEYIHISLLRENAWGNFKELIKKVTVDPAMLRFLNGNLNTAAAPNENYARELFELYTIGKGPLADSGDYTTFTEEDVLTAARILTGWRDRGFLRRDAGIEPGAYFTASRHDPNPKKLSHRFNGAILYNGGSDEYSKLVDIIFEQKEAARFICRKWYRWFVYYVIDDDTEVNVIEPMSDLLVASNFEIRPVLEALFRSTHFYSQRNLGPMIKNPIDFLTSAFKQFNVRFSNNYPNYYNAWSQFFRLLPLLQMEYLNPPDVAGWKAYYQEPSFYRTWINSSTLPVRMELVEKLSTTGFTFNNFTHRIDILSLVKDLDNPADPNELIRELARLLYPQPLTGNQVKALKEVLIPGLDDYVWTNEYLEYENNPNDRNLRSTVESRLTALLRLMLAMPEYQLS